MQVASAADYYPFGWEMPGRKYNSSEYRYGFNGKEKDQDGEFGRLTDYDYGFRIYNPAVGRFLSVDPLRAEYPWYTPYQFAGNMPIAAIDLDGLEPYFSYYPNALPKERDITASAKDVFNASGGQKEFLQQPAIGDLGRNIPCSGCLIQGQGASKDKHNRYVNNNNAFQVNGRITPDNFVNILMGHFVNGTGPENYIFPLDGAVSNEMRNSAIFSNTFDKFLNENLDAIASSGNLKGHSSGSGFGVSEQLSSAFRNAGILNVENFVGSAKVTIKPINNDEVLVTIFNVTSLTSGDYYKHFSADSYPNSIVRNPSRSTQEAQSNISQTFSFTVQITSAMRQRAREAKTKPEEPIPIMTIPKY